LRERWVSRSVERSVATAVLGAHDGRAGQSPADQRSRRARRTTNSTAARMSAAGQNGIPTGRRSAIASVARSAAERRTAPVPPRRPTSARAPNATSVASHWPHREPSCGDRRVRLLGSGRAAGFAGVSRPPTGRGIGPWGLLDARDGRPPEPVSAARSSAARRAGSSRTAYEALIRAIAAVVPPRSGCCSSAFRRKAARITVRSESGAIPRAAAADERSQGAPVNGAPSARARARSPGGGSR
jgi:hypothetical protein